MSLVLIIYCSHHKQTHSIYINIYLLWTDPHTKFIWFFLNFVLTILIQSHQSLLISKPFEIDSQNCQSNEPTWQNHWWTNYLKSFFYLDYKPPIYLHSIFEILHFEISSLMNLIFSLFQTWILQARASRKIQIKLDKNPAHPTGYLTRDNCKNQVQIDRGLSSRNLCNNLNFSDLFLF